MGGQWTRAEDDRLVALAREHRIDKVEEDMGRTKHAIRYRAHKLGVSFSHPTKLSDHDIELIEALVADGVKQVRVAEKFDVSEATISAIVNGTYVRRMKPKRKVTIVVGHTHDSQGAQNEALGVTEWQYCVDLAAWIARSLCRDLHVEVMHRDCKFSQLPAKVNASLPSLVLSLHLQSMPATFSSAHVRHRDGDTRAYAAGAKVRDAVLGVVKPEDFTISPPPSESSDEFFLKNVNAPAIVLRPFNVNNNKDFSAGYDHVARLGAAISKALLTTVKEMEQ